MKPAKKSTKTPVKKTRKIGTGALTVEDVYAILEREDHRVIRAQAAHEKRSLEMFKMLAGVLPVIMGMVTGRRMPMGIPGMSEAPGGPNVQATAFAFVKSLAPEQVQTISATLMPAQLEALHEIATGLGINLTPTPATPTGGPPDQSH